MSYVLVFVLTYFDLSVHCFLSFTRKLPSADPVSEQLLISYGRLSYFNFVADRWHLGPHPPSVSARGLSGFDPGNISVRLGVFVPGNKFFGSA